MQAEHEQLLAQLPHAVRLAYCASRRRATKPGTERWIFPKLLLPAQEAALRSSHSAIRGSACASAPSPTPLADLGTRARSAASGGARCRKRGLHET